MKLLLTSGGLRNPTIIKAFVELTGKPISRIKLAFVPTAMHATEGNKGWLIDNLTLLKSLNFKQIDIVDVAVLAKAELLSRLKESDVIYVNGGNTTFLMKCFNKSGLTDELPNLLKSRVYVGVSAGSYVATPDLRFNSDNVKEVLEGLHFVDFGLQVHLNSPKFAFAKSPAAVAKRIKEKAPPHTVYALDDQMAVKIDGKKIEFVGEGQYITFEPDRKEIKHDLRRR